MHEEQISRILVYRLGSIGDFVVSLPCFHLLRRRFPNSSIGLLTNRPVESRAAAAATIMNGSGLVDWYITYPVGTRSLADLAAVVRSIRAKRPELVVYLAGPRGTWSLYRDLIFFRVCGVSDIRGFPFAPDSRRCRPPGNAGGLWEREASRLGRCIAEFGAAATEDPRNWDLNLSQAEIAEADRAVAAALGADFARTPLLGLSIGTKQAIKDWGDANWKEVLSNLSHLRFPLALIGAAEERDRSSEIAKAWQGPVLNFCGRLSPRVSAAVMKRMRLFLCHDSGPMHLAAAVGTPCVAVFANIDFPGRMFPAGTQHHILFPPAAPNSIKLITPPQVVKEILAALRQDSGKTI